MALAAAVKLDIEKAEHSGEPAAFAGQPEVAGAAHRALVIESDFHT